MGYQFKVSVPAVTVEAPNQGMDVTTPERVTVQGELNGESDMWGYAPSMTLEKLVAYLTPLVQRAYDDGGKAGYEKGVQDAFGTAKRACERAGLTVELNLDK